MKKKRISPEETRRQLISSGLHLFGVKGFEATKTRELAELAEVNQAAIPYHFGGKEGLYLAVSEYVVQRGLDSTQKSAAEITQRLEAHALDRKEAGELLIRFLHSFMDQVILSEDIGDRSRFILREYTTPGAGFDIIYKGLLEKTHRLMCRLVGIIEDRSPESEAVILKTQAIFGMIMSNVATRNLLFRRLEWNGFTGERVEMIKTILVEMVCQGLSLDVPDKYTEQA